MARSNQNRKKTLVILISLLVFLLLASVLTVLILKKPDEFAKLPNFPIDTYLDGKQLWSHEDYKIQGRVDNVLLQSASGLKLLVSIQPEGSILRLPVLVEKVLDAPPIQREQNLIMRVNLGSASQIICKQYRGK